MLRSRREGIDEAGDNRVSWPDYPEILPTG